VRGLTMHALALALRVPATRLSDIVRAIVDLDLTEVQAVIPPRGFGRD